MAGHGYHWENALAGVFKAQTPGTALPKIPTAGIYVGGAGNVEVVDMENQTTTFMAVPAGTILPIKVQSITSNTTATNLVVLY